MASRPPSSREHLDALRKTSLTLDRESFLDLAQQILARGKSLRFQAKGWSMHPFVLEGDILTIAPLRRPPRLGEIVLFKNPCGGATVHRVIKVLPASIIVKGDAIGYPDGRISHQDALGVVEVVERGNVQMRLQVGWRRWFAQLVAFLSPFSEQLRPMVAPIYRLFRKYFQPPTD